MKVAILSDIHANIFALEAVYRDLDKEAVDHILIAGDIIGYYYWPKEVLNIIKNDDRVLCVRGNHENILANIIKNPESIQKYQRKYGHGYNVCLEKLSLDELDWLVMLPESQYLSLDGCSFYMTHGSLSGVDDYLYPDAPLEELKKNYSNSMITIFGHTHYQFIHSMKDKILLNPGSVGQARDIGGLASYAIYNTSNLTIRFKRIRFDYSELTEVSKAKDSDLSYLWKIMQR